jgi:hypothetical protein
MLRTIPGARHVTATGIYLLFGLAAAACSASKDEPLVDEQLSESSTQLTLELRPAGAAETNTQHVEFGYLNQVFLPCAAGGAGEFVVLQGRFEGVVHTTIDARGRFHIGVQLRPAFVTGTGETTGDEYRLRGASHDQLHGTAPAEFTFTNEFRIVAPGPNNDAITTLTLHYTVDASGVLSVSVGGGGAECL